MDNKDNKDSRVNSSSSSRPDNSRRNEGYNQNNPYRKNDYGYSSQRGGQSRPNNNKKVKLKVTSVREKTETQEYISYGEEKIETFFPVPVNTSIPYFQRSVGMAEGTIIEANEKGNGTVEIDGIQYPMKENRTPVLQKRYPLTKYVGKKVKFSFYPTITSKGIKILGLKPDAPPFIKIANFRKELAKQGAVEALGTVKEIKDKHFMVSIWSGISKKEYVVIIFGRCTAKVGDFVKVDSVLKDGLIQVENIKVLNKK